jgi:hypothetical protein
MAFDEKDIDVFQLLKKLKAANGVYPQELLASRRQMYLRQLAEVGGGVGLAAALKNTAKNGGKAVGLPPVAGTLLESLLVVAIVAEVGTVTYLYRDKIKEFFQGVSNSPNVEQISSPPVVSSPIPGVEISLSLTPIAAETEAITETATPEVTPSLLAEQPTDVGGEQSSESSSGGGGSAISTPAAPNDNNGNHYGQTPIPQRTKEPGNNNNDTQNQTRPHRNHP